ncbi:hypothetical protein NCCP2495_13320 [Dietzia sp. NCCP-2495]|uniref:hypothetical protein n=1 Tax=Dietzia sp. NCCP-2495 TaxID=2934675 RepID=UPI0022300175|nr:hypothetical protein [Dietzia sp. NCCP-2495]GLB63453.1 hypothetical protein NCCP2495_13320 [Dietzia sp. NCCP-2495]
MSFVIVVTPAESEYRDATDLALLPERLRADLEALRDEIDERFPESDAIGETGALSERPTIEGVGVVIHPEVLTRPLVVNAVMRFAARRQLLVTSPELGLVADPRDRIDIDVHRRPTMAGAAITDHAVRGRPYGTLPWVTRELLEQLLAALVVDGDRLELECDAQRWFLCERVDGELAVSVADGPDTALRARVLSPGHLGLVADAGWAWARNDADWTAFFGAPEVSAA